MSERSVDEAANRYVMIMLLQRLEIIMPGLHQELLEGARADRAAAGEALDVFDAAIALIERAAPT